MSREDYPATHELIEARKELLKAADRFRKAIFGIIEREEHVPGRQGNLRPIYTRVCKLQFDLSEMDIANMLGSEIEDSE